MSWTYDVIKYWEDYELSERMSDDDNFVLGYFKISEKIYVVIFKGKDGFEAHFYVNFHNKVNCLNAHTCLVKNIHHLYHNDINVTVARFTDFLVNDAKQFILDEMVKVTNTLFD